MRIEVTSWTSRTRDRPLQSSCEGSRDINEKREMEFHHSSLASTAESSPQPPFSASMPIFILFAYPLHLFPIIHGHSSGSDGGSCTVGRSLTRICSILSLLGVKEGFGSVLQVWGRTIHVILTEWRCSTVSASSISVWARGCSVWMRSTKTGCVCSLRLMLASSTACWSQRLHASAASHTTRVILGARPPRGALDMSRRRAENERC